MRYLVTNFQLFRNKLKTKKHLNFFGKRWYASKGCELREKKELVLGVYEQENDKTCLIPSAKKIDEHLGGKLRKLVKAVVNKIREKRPKAHGNADKDLWFITLVNLRKEYVELEAINQNLKRGGDRKLSNDGATRILVESHGKPEQAAKRSAVCLKIYQNQMAESQNLTRRPCNVLANQITPLHLARETASELFSRDAQVHDKDAEFVVSTNTLGLPLNLNEHMPSGVVRVVKGVNGNSMIITNTRLILTNSLTYGQKTQKPKLIGLGSGASGVRLQSGRRRCQVRNRGVDKDDRVLRLLFWKHQVKSIASQDVDCIKHHRGVFFLPEAFIYEFVYCVHSIHFEVTGVGIKCEVKFFMYFTKGRKTGRPAGMIIQLLYLLACPNPKT